MEKIKNLLNQVTIISKKNAEILDATGGRFNMFRICGVNHYENTHSAILAEFLNPNGTHGLKSQLLECFIETLGEYFTVQFFNYKKARVKTEHSTEEGRIDILIEDNQNKAIIIENKIYANDQPEQLKRYDRYAKVYKNGYQIIYLTLFGYDASKQSGEGVSYLSISYKEIIISWLEKCVGIASRFPIVRETIIQYINHLKQLTNQDMELQIIQSKIYEIRGMRVMLDYDLAEMYQVETKNLKRSVRRNIERFPEDFMFELTKEEYDFLRCNFGTLENSGRGQYAKYLPFAFTKQGIAQLSSVLNSPLAIQVNISIIRAFVTLRQYALGYAELNRKLEDFMVETNMQFSDIYQALTELASQKELEEKPRRRIGFNAQNEK
jgi:hypothetical protein